MSEAGVVIVGAGIAGAATAYFLARRGLRGIVVVEGENRPDAHSSGRNAGILRTATGDPALSALARESAAFYRRPPAGFSRRPLVDGAGFYLAAPAAARGAVEKLAAEGGRVAGARELYERVPALAPGVEAVASFPDEGALDVAAIHEGFLEGAADAGAELRYGCRAAALVVERGQVAGVQTASGVLPCRAVVLAGGAWASDLAAGAGVPLPLTAFRRHLLVAACSRPVDERWPVVWLPTEGFYFRPQEGGLLLCPCDNERIDPQHGEEAGEAWERACRDKARRWLPGVELEGRLAFWAGMRVFAPDRRFVVGPDPRLPGLHWAAGLGGHGISTAAAVGRLAAEWIADGWSAHPAAADLAPDRLLPEPRVTGGVPRPGGGTRP